MIVALICTVFVLAALLVGALISAYRFYRRAVIYDEVFQFLSWDIEVNIKQFAKMNNSSVLGNDHEIQTAHRNMVVMGKRLEEILVRMEESTGLNLRQPPPPPRPKFE